jgi:dGTP triphosphohydrolase
LYVAQLSRIVAHKNGLNVDLAEAIAYGHDVGHAPFGHAGEKALNLCLYEYFVRQAINEVGVPDIGGLSEKKDQNKKYLDQAIWHLVQWLANLESSNPKHRLPSYTEIKEVLQLQIIQRLIDENVLRVAKDVCSFNEPLDWNRMPSGPYSIDQEFMVQRGKSELFAHYTNSLRVLLCHPQRQKVDLTRQTAYGILSHSWRGPYDSFRLHEQNVPGGKIDFTNKDETPEAFLVRMADNISFVNSDLNDACASGIISWSDLSEKHQKMIGDLAKLTARVDIFPSTSRRLQHCETGFKFTYGKVPDYKFKKLIEDISHFVIEQKVHTVLIPRQESAKHIIRELFWFLCRRGACKRSVEKKALDMYNTFNSEKWGSDSPSTPRLAADYIAWLTDDEAIAMHRALFAPEHASWERYFLDAKDT